MTTQKFGSTRRARLFIVPFVALLAACASSSGPRPIFSREAGDGDNITITADNQNFLDATVYAVWSGAARERIGMVTGLTSQTFQVDDRASELQIEIDFIGGGSVTTGRIGVYPGDHLELVIPPA